MSDQGINYAAKYEAAISRAEKAESESAALRAELATVKAERDEARREHVMPRYWEAERELSAAKAERDRALSDLARAEAVVDAARNMAFDYECAVAALADANEDEDAVDESRALRDALAEALRAHDRAQPAKGATEHTSTTVDDRAPSPCPTCPTCDAGLERLRADIERIAARVESNDDQIDLHRLMVLDPDAFRGYVTNAVERIARRIVRDACTMVSSIDREAPGFDHGKPCELMALAAALSEEKAEARVASLIHLLQEKSHG